MKLCTFTDGLCAGCGTRREPPYPVRRCRPGLGDRVAAGLEAVGITKARATAVASAIGLADCGCLARQHWLNQAGDRLGNLGKPGTLTPFSNHGNLPK